MQEITVKHLKQKFDNKGDFQLIDVRETFEYEMSNIGGENIPLAGILIETDRISKDKLVIVGFPANDFGSQEPGSNKEISAFCTKKLRARISPCARTPPNPFTENPCCLRRR